MKVGRRDVAHLLVAKGADVNTKDNQGWTPLHYVAAKGDADLTQLMVAKLVDAKALHPLEALPDWDGRKTLGVALDKWGWEPSSDTEQVYVWVCRGDGESLGAHWEKTRGVLLDDVRSGSRRKIQNAVYTFVSLAKEEIIPELVRILDSEGNIEMAETFLNCGQDELEKAARSWADRHGYRISTGVGAHKATWGRW